MLHQPDADVSPKEPGIATSFSSSETEGRKNDELLPRLPPTSSPPTDINSSLFQDEDRPPLEHTGSSSKTFLGFEKDTPVTIVDRIPLLPHRSSDSMPFHTSLRNVGAMEAPLLQETEVERRDETNADASNGSERPPISPLVDSTPWSTPLWKHWRTYVVFLAVISLLLFNGAVLALHVKTIRFGQYIIGSDNGIQDSDVITIINVLSKILEGITAVLGGWTVSQLWSRRLCDGHTGAGIAELQSLSVFSSIAGLFTVLFHALKRNFSHVDRNWHYIAYLGSALLLQAYSTAIVTLGIPALVSVVDEPTTFSYIDLAYMSNPGIGASCGDDGFGLIRAQACLGNMLVGNAMTDIVYFASGNKPIDGFWTNPYWMAVATEYSPIGIQLSNPLGPLNNVNMSAGSVLFGHNRGTLEGLIGYYGSPHAYIQDSTAYSVDVNTTTPILTAQCVLTSYASSVSQLEIANKTYQLQTPIPRLLEGEIAGQMTTDNVTLVISLRDTNVSSNISCAINLGLRSGRIMINQDSGGIQSWPNEDPWNWGDLSPLFDAVQVPIGPFASLWLEGMGWSETPTKNGMSIYLGASELAVGAGSSNTSNVTGNGFAEHYVLTMFASGVALGFPQERTRGATSTTPLSTRSYQVTKTQYYIGARSKTRWFFFGVIVFDTLFVLWCVSVLIETGRWMPDWNDPAALLCTAVCSPSITACSKSCAGSVASEAWRVQLALELDAGSGHLIFAPREEVLARLRPPFAPSLSD